jgi:hypothetical protein
MSEQDSNQAKAYTIYKPRKSGDGVASRFDYNRETGNLFFEMAEQTDQMKNGRPTFNWQEKIVFKLGAQDISDIMLVLTGKQGGVGQNGGGRYQGLYHKRSDGDSIMHFEKSDKPGSFFVSLSVRGKAQKKLTQMVSQQEALILTVLLTDAIRAMYGWN